MTEQKAHELLEKWIRVLRLQEWEIRFHWRVDPKCMALPESMGCTSDNEVNRQALIEIADEALHERGARDFEFDYEQTLVHELMHLKLSLLDDTNDPAQNRTVHILCDSLARSLVEAKRGEVNC